MSGTLLYINFVYSNLGYDFVGSYKIDLTRWLDISWFLKNVSVDADEKIELQITVLLTMVIYVEVLQSNIPVFNTYHM